MDPSWLYTAITRAERQVVLVGPRDVLQSALLRPRTAIRRRVGLEWSKLPEALDGARTRLWPSTAGLDRRRGPGSNA